MLILLAAFDENVSLSQPARIPFEGGFRCYVKALSTCVWGVPSQIFSTREIYFDTGL